MRNTLPILILCIVLLNPVYAGDAGIIDTLPGLNSTMPIGVSWAAQESRTTGWLQSAAWSGTRFVAVGIYGSILVSSDGRSWDSASSSIPLDLYDVVWSGGQFVAVGCDNNFLRYCIIRSPDGISWCFASRVSDPIEGLYSIAHSDSGYVAVGYGGQVFSSDDGDTWDRQVDTDSMLGKSLYGVTWSGSEFVAVGEIWDPDVPGWNALVATSPDGLDWSYRNLGALGLLFDVTWNGERYIAVGYSGVWGISMGLIATSADGLEWTMKRFGTADYLRAVSSAGSTIIAVGDDGTILTSDDGNDWTTQESGTDVTLSGIATSDGRVVVVGTSGTILASP